MPKIGAHESVSGGLHLAFERITRVGGDALQIFTRNQRQWKPAELKEEEVRLFREAHEVSGLIPVASHGSYLVNFATGKEDLLQKSTDAFVLELQRCQQLKVPYVVLHPGSHGGDGAEAGLERFVAGLDHAIERSETGVEVLLETTAGQGTGLGRSFEELACILQNSRCSDQLGICVDTCHIFAAGYDIRSAESYNATIAELDRQVGLERVKFFHLNDSKKELGSRVDRHEHIGKGAIGLGGFKNLLNDPRFAGLPMTLETPKGDDLKEDRENIRILRSLMESN
ncbi:MAG: deoxyribonuclease IV [Deltaproteobacteria bacterium]|nr:deoxyribonuclease IV [Deltaproteobacteria bacterium]